jgi:excinuclease UvrABC nuclease subunit
MHERLVPQPHAVYRLFNKRGRLLYVGCAHNPFSRIAEHRYWKHWWKEVARVQMDFFPNGRAAEKAEREAIWNENPKYNVEKYRSRRLALLKAAEAKIPAEMPEAETRTPPPGVSASQ